MSEKQRKGPSLSAIAALVSLAAALWMEVDLPDALLRAVLVYLGLSMVSMTYRVILGKFITHSYEKAQKELLDRIQREAEEERQKQKQEEQKKREANAKAAKTEQVVTSE
ncbi:MAG: hypothetical protein NTW14_08620 [bacterium]|nr:hypothetical protein [bacterium]